MSDYIVRKAVRDDIDWLMGQYVYFSEFFNSKYSLFNKERAREVTENLIDSHLFLIAEVRGEKAGFISGLITPHLFNPQIITLLEVLFWVEPKHRGSRAAAYLMNKFVEIGKQIAQWVVMTKEAHSPISERGILKRGFVIKEQAYLMEI